jgi:hypothetical protein
MKNNDIILPETSRDGIGRPGFLKCMGWAGQAVACSISGGILTSLAKTAGRLLLLGCFLLQGQATAGVPLPAVESTHPGQYDKVSFGYLKVFSATQESQWGEGSFYYLHTGYRIYDASGKTLKWIENHASSIDEDPEKVELAPGSYTVWAQSDKDGYVKVPVVIKLAQTTAVHLENDR